jgi:hypothetical protein
MARPRGYADWNPKPETLILIDQVRAILDEYRSYGAMTARQVFYRLVGSYGYPKTERDYENLCEKLVRARRAEMIPFSAIRDDKVSEHAAGSGYDDPAQFWRAVRNDGQYYGRPTREGQDHRIELWVEAGGMAEMVAKMARPYGVPVFSAGGFLSVTATHDIARRALAEDDATVLLHIGDYDPSGESIFTAILEDASAFYVGRSGGGLISDYEDLFRAERVALTLDQVDEYEIDTAPPKKSDGRSKRWEDEGRFQTAQAEAIDPPLLKTMVEQACEEWTDMDQLREVEAESEIERAAIVEELERLIDGRED